MNTKFYKINLNEWNRTQYFYYFTKMLPTGYSISMNIDITNTYNILNRRRLLKKLELIHGPFNINKKDS